MPRGQRGVAAAVRCVHIRCGGRACPKGSFLAFQLGRANWAAADHNLFRFIMYTTAFFEGCSHLDSRCVHGRMSRRNPGRRFPLEKANGRAGVFKEDSHQGPPSVRRLGPFVLTHFEPSQCSFLVNSYTIGYACYFSLILVSI